MYNMENLIKDASFIKESIILDDLEDIIEHNKTIYLVTRFKKRLLIIPLKIIDIKLPNLIKFEIYNKLENNLKKSYWFKISEFNLNSKLIDIHSKNQDRLFFNFEAAEDYQKLLLI